jgi:hypothetical protein
MFRKACGTLLVLASTSPLARAGGLPPRDAIDLSQATVWNSPPDIASWPVTGAITQLTMQPGQSAGLSFVFPQHNTWPNYTPPGWDGPIQYTVWAAVRINGQWHTSGIIQMWRERPSTGAPILTDFARNWVYDGRWGAMANYQPQVGEQMGFFVSAGNARGVGTVTSVRERTNVVVVSLPANDIGVFAFPATRRTIAALDVDGDGRADIGVFRPSTGFWWGLASSTNYSSYASVHWGGTGDIPVPGDYDGDGKTDIAIWRPSTGVWWVLNSSTNFTSSTSTQWGSPGDIPAPGDYDGDGVTDPTIYRPSTGLWYSLKSTTNYTAALIVQWGIGSDIPVPGDYDGDGKTDIAIWRPSTGAWWVLNSGTNFTSSTAILWGSPGDTPVPGDYDGDGKTDIAVWRPSSGVWWVLNSSNNFTSPTLAQWGSPGDTPVPADYDGDGKMDVAVYRPSEGKWYLLVSGSNYSTPAVYHWGVSTDIPVGNP